MTVLMWSGGKDSTASLILAKEKNIKIDLVIMGVLWFDKARGICGENPKHMEFVKNVAIPKFEEWGYKVLLIDGKFDYVRNFNYIINRSKKPEKNGKKRGFLIGGLCVMNKEKILPSDRYLKSLKEPVTKIIGICADEPERLESRLFEKDGNRSLLAEYGYTEQMAKELCEKHGLLSPIYETVWRGGCWFCPNQRISEFADLKKEYPHLYKELEILSKDENLASKNFKWGQTFDEVDREVDNYIYTEKQQIRLF